MQPHIAITTDPRVFGAANADDKLCGAFVKTTVPMIYDSDLPLLLTKPLVGRVVLAKNGEVVIVTEFGFLGWLTAGEYELVNFVLPERITLH